MDIRRNANDSRRAGQESIRNSFSANGPGLRSMFGLGGSTYD
jgi:hypothetical protein